MHIVGGSSPFREPLFCFGERGKRGGAFFPPNFQQMKFGTKYCFVYLSLLIDDRSGSSLLEHVPAVLDGAQLQQDKCLAAMNSMSNC